MSPIRTIEKLNDTFDGGLRGAVNLRVSQLFYEMEEIRERWEGLKNAGGAREDHAAELLGTLRPHFQCLADFFQRCAAQTDAMKADPFERNAAV